MAQIKPQNGCPLNRFKPCRELECAWFTKVAGHNPNTGHEVEEWACAMAWAPVLLIENSQMQRQTGAAVESFRNETVKAARGAIGQDSPMRLEYGGE